MLKPDTSADDAHMEEMLPEEYHIVTESDRYVRIDWFAEDPAPKESFFMTSDFGPCPKCIAILDDISCVRTDFSMISKS